MAWLPVTSSTVEIPLLLTHSKSLKFALIPVFATFLQLFPMEFVNMAIKISQNNNSSYPFTVTKVCRNPSFLNISTTVSIGVWSVIVTGAYNNYKKYQEKLS